MTKLKRTGKDSIFCDLFSQDDYLLELYRTLHPEDGSVSAADLELVTVERVLTDGEYNDLGFTVGSRLMVLVEAQSTWSANIVTRMLLYTAETYRRLLEGTDRALHKARVVRVPAPELYVVYTGRRGAPEEILLVGDVLGGAASAVEVRARVLRGGGDDVVGQYVECTRVIDEVREMDIPVGDKARAVVETCIERGILVAYFEGRRTEVTDMMYTVFDAEREERLYREELRKRAVEEGREQGLEEGIEEGIEQGIARMADILRTAGVDEAAIEAAVAAASQPELAS